MASNPSTSTRNPPVFGILSRQALESPEIHYILPIQIRSAQLSDVALVGERFVHIKHVDYATGKLYNVTTKADFTGKIRNARVLGDPLPASHTATTPALGIQRTESSPASAQSISSWPPQALILTLDSGDLVFLTMHSQDESRTFKLMTNTVSLGALHTAGDDTDHLLTNPAAFLAVDPTNSIIAAASLNGNISFWLVSPRNQGQSQSVAEATSQLQHIETNVMILKMEFLYFPQDGVASQCLLVIGTDCQSRKPTVKLYHRVSSGLSRFEPMVVALPRHLVSGKGFPRLLIPLRKVLGAFLLISDQSATIYEDIHVANCKVATSISLDQLGNIPKNPTATWKGWCRPYRNQIRERYEDTFYLIRDDGVLAYFTVQVDEGKYNSCECIYVNTIYGNASQAFNHDGRALTRPDGVILAGLHSDGGVFEIGRNQRKHSILHDPHDPEVRKATMVTFTVETLYNWAPLLDLAIDPYDPLRKSDEGSFSGMATRTSRIFGTSGRDPYGAVTIFRHGHEAVVNETYEIKVTRVWAIDLDHGHFAVLMSSPPGQNAWALDLHDAPQQINVLRGDGGQTFAAARVLQKDVNVKEQERYLMHVTATGITLLMFNMESLSLSQLRWFQHRGDDRVMAATVFESTGYVLFNSKIEITRVYYNGMWQSDKRNIEVDLADEQATCMTVFHLRMKNTLTEGEYHNGFTSSHDSPVQNERAADLLIIAVALDSGKLALIDVTAMETRQSEERMSVIDLGTMMGADQPQTCNSLAIIPKSNESETCIFVCGLRNGVLLSFEFTSETFRNGNQSRPATYRQQLGQSPVEVRQVDQHSKMLFLTCDSNAMAFEYNQSEQPPSLHSIWFVDHGNRAQTFPLTDMSIPFFSESTPLVAISGDHVLSASMDNRLKPIPLRLPVPGSPTRLVYSTALKRLFVTSNIVDTSEAVNVSRSQLYVVDPYDPKHQTPAASFTTDPDTIITQLVEWSTFNDGDSFYTILAVVAMRTGNSDGAGGLLALCKIEKARNKVHMTPLKALKYKDGIRAACAFNNSQLILAVGDQLRMVTNVGNYEASFQSTRLFQFEEGDIVHSLSSEAPFVHVSSALGSLRTYTLNGQQLQLVQTTNAEFACLSHLPVADRGILLATDKNKKIYGLRRPAGAGGVINSAAPLFIAELPMSMTRICRVDARPPWLPRAATPSCDGGYLAAAPDGSMWALSLLSEKLWRLLTAMQQLLGGEEAGGGHRHVDGDILGRHVEVSGAAAALAAKLEAAAASELPTKFERVVRDVEEEMGLGWEVAEEEEDEDEERGRRTALRAVEIARGVLRTPF